MLVIYGVQHFNTNNELTVWRKVLSWQTVFATTIDITYQHYWCFSNLWKIRRQRRIGHLYEGWSHTSPSIALPQEQVFFLFCITSNFSRYVYSLPNCKQDMSKQYQKKFEGQTWKFFICLFSYLAFLNIQLTQK